ncbi:MAG TPA: hypothetical protein VFD38_11695 [Myxococcaceae bacterium]|nr:hypothetical protein [Myxococcaceae bacterium]
MRSLAALALLVAACDSTPASERARIWVPSDLAEAARNGATVAGLDAGSLVAPGGATIPWLSPPHTAAAAVQPAGTDGLVVVPAWLAAQPAAYVVAEVWQEVPEAWLQPWYVLFQVPSSGPPAARVPNTDPVVDVLPPSFFYSPFWQLINVVIPPGASPEAYRDARTLVDPSLPRTEANPLLAVLSPGDVVLAAPAGVAPVRPLSGDPVASPRPGAVWVRGAHQASLGFGSGGFRWGEDGRVVEVPLYRFIRQDGRSLLLPDVLGTGPEGQPEPLVLGSTGAPRSGAFSRLILVVPPASAGVFLPADAPLRGASVLSGALQVPEPAPEIAARPDVAQYVGRVALNPACFTDVAGFPGSCRWLDRQEAVEGALLDRRPQPVRFTSPLVGYAGKPVPR